MRLKIRPDKNSPICLKRPQSRRRQKAQTTMEYIILIVIVAIIAVKMGGTLQDKINNLMGKNFTKAEGKVDELWQ